MRAFLSLLCVVLLVDCGPDDAKTAAPAPAVKSADTPQAAPATKPGLDPDDVQKLAVRSTAFVDGADVPAPYTCAGEDKSPPLEWHPGPPGTKCYALVCEDPDATDGAFAHWVAWNITGTSLAEAVPAGEKLGEGGRQGTNGFGTLGYKGPCPPAGPAHRYFFRIYALDAPLVLPPTTTSAEVMKALQGHVLGRGALVGKFAAAGG